MGSFSYTCKLTGLPITSGDKVVLLPLLPNLSRFDNSEGHIEKFGTTHYCSNDGTRVLFAPCLFPIFGEYNDYGGMENIIEDDNTKCLEKYFELTIQQIVDIICSGRKDDGCDDALKVIKKKKLSPARYNKWKETNPDTEDDYGKPKYEDRYKILVKISATWMRKEIYDGLAKESSGDYFDKVDIGTPAILEALGFKQEIDKTAEKAQALKDEEETETFIDDFIKKKRKELGVNEGESLEEKVNEETKKKIQQELQDALINLFLKKGESKPRFHQKWVRGKVVLYGDGNWIQTTKGNMGNSNLYCIKDLAKYCKQKKDPIEQNIIDEVDRKDLNEQIYDYILPTVKKFDERSRWEGDRIRHLFLQQIYSDPHPFSKFYFKQIKENGKDFMRKNIVDFHRVERYWFSMGKFFEPVGTSPQDGDHENVLKVTKLAYNVLKQQIKERNEH